MLRTIVGLIAKQGAVVAAKNRISIIIKTVVREYLFFSYRVKIRAEISNNKMCQQCTNNMQRVSFKYSRVPNNVEDTFINP